MGLGLGLFEGSGSFMELEFFVERKRMDLGA